MAGGLVRRGRLVAALVCAVLASCGGGGGGAGGTSGASAPSTPVSVGNVRFQALDHEAFEGDDRIPPLAITADVTGDLSVLAGKTVYVLVEDPDQLYASNPSLSLTSTGLGNQLTLFARGPNTRVGTFQGNLKVNVCLDAECRQPFGGSPFAVPYKLKVLPGLKIAEAGNIALNWKFGEPLPTWRSDVTLPAGATGFGSAVFKRGFQILSSVAAASNDARAVTVQASPTHVAVHDLDLYLEAVGTTSTGRKVTLSERRALTYTITPPDKPTVVYTPSTATLVRSSTAPENFGSVVNLVAPQAEPFYVSTRVEYLNATNGGVDDAKGFRWLDMGAVSSVVNGSELVVRTEAWYRLDVQCQMSGPRCMPPGVYVARVFFLTAAGQEAPHPFVVRLDLQP
jgi:hypothetical protein